jgi:hypothetical protein
LFSWIIASAGEISKGLFDKAQGGPAPSGRSVVPFCPARHVEICRSRLSSVPIQVREPPRGGIYLPGLGVLLFYFVL